MALSFLCGGMSPPVVSGNPFPETPAQTICYFIPTGLLFLLYVKRMELIAKNEEREREGVRCYSGFEWGEGGTGIPKRGRVTGQRTTRPETADLKGCGHWGQRTCELSSRNFMEVRGTSWTGVGAIDAAAGGWFVSGFPERLRRACFTQTVVLAPQIPKHRGLVSFQCDCDSIAVNCS